MSYRDNVQKLCDELNIANPIQEEDVRVKAVELWDGSKWQMFGATDMNRAGRLFFQFFETFGRVQPGGVFLIDQKFIMLASLFFAENWDDAEKIGRPMLLALKSATRFRLCRG